MEHLLPSVPSTKSAYRVAIVILIETMDPISMPSMVDLPEAAHWLSQPVDPEVTPLSEILLKAVNSIAVSHDLTRPRRTILTVQPVADAHY